MRVSALHEPIGCVLAINLMQFVIYCFQEEDYHQNGCLSMFVVHDDIH